MRYRKGFKYQLDEIEIFQTSFRPKKDIITRFVVLRNGGQLELLEGFAWDGPSGPVIDRKTNMRGSAGHDGLYRLMRKGLLDHRLWKIADICFGRWIAEDGAWPITVWADLTGLAIAKGAAANPKNIAKVYEINNGAYNG